MVCSDDSIHIPLKLTWIVKGTFKPILEGFAWSHSSITLLISHWKFALTSWVFVNGKFSSCSFSFQYYYPPQSNNFFLKSFYFFDITSLFYWNLLRFLISFIRLIPLFLSLTASLFATASCKNVETLQRKTAFFGFKSLLVTLLCNIILASLLLSIQSCSSSFEHGLLLLATSTRGGRKYKVIDS